MRRFPCLSLSLRRVPTSLDRFKATTTEKVHSQSGKPAEICASLDTDLESRSGLLMTKLVSTQVTRELIVQRLARYPTCRHFLFSLAELVIPLGSVAKKSRDAC